MNGIEKIISRMEADAKAERDAITAAAQQKAETIRHDYQATADALQQEAQVRRQAQNAERLEHLNGSSQMACRQRVLAVKQEVIDEAFSQAAQQLTQLPAEQYVPLLAALAADNGVGDEEILLSAADRQAVGQAVVDAANARKSGAAFRLSDETRETGGGLVLRRGKVELQSCCLTERGYPFDKTQKGHRLSVSGLPCPGAGAEAADGAADRTAADHR